MWQTTSVIVRTGKNLAFHQRSSRLLLFLTFVHTIPVVWIIPVAAGTAPTSALLAFGIASLFTFDHESVALGLFALLPGLIYAALAWVLAWLIGRFTTGFSRPARLASLTIGVVAPLVAVYFPIYLAGGHNSSYNSNLIDLFAGSLPTTVTLPYWITLHVILAFLYVAQWFSPGSRLISTAERWRKPVTGGCVLGLACVVVYTSYPNVICRPLAELGNNAAQVCVAKSDRVQARYWYERAASDGHAEAIAWLVENTSNRQTRLDWLRKGASAGDAESQYLLAKHLQRLSDSSSHAEATRWLDASAKGHSTLR